TLPGAQPPSRASPRRSTTNVPSSACRSSAMLWRRRLRQCRYPESLPARRRACPRLLGGGFDTGERMNGDFRANDAFYQRDGVATGRGFSAPPPLTTSQQGIPLKKQSGLGITSFVAAIVAWLAYFCAIGAVMIGAASDQSGNKVLDKVMMVTFFATIIGG